MSKQLYPKPKKAIVRRVASQRNLNDLPYHVLYSDPDNPTAPTQWGHYATELAVKLAAWYHCRLVGFTRSAVLYSRDELKQLTDGK